jgi:hypothetical protein
LPNNRLYINNIANYAQKLADYTFISAGQAEKVQIARYCVCTTYPHYVPLTLDCAHFFATPLKTAKFVGALLARVEMQLKRPNFPDHAREF